MSEPVAAASPVALLARRQRGRRHLVLAALLAGLGLAAWAELSLGAVALTPGELWRALSGAGDPTHAAIVTALRAPRLVLAAVGGAALAAGGVALQALFRNPLADPALVGVSAGGAVGAATATVLLPLGLRAWGAGPAMSGGAAAGGAGAAVAGPALAFAGAVAAAALLLRIGRRGGRPNVARMLLAGVALNALAGALVGVALHLADSQGLRALTGWMLGSLSGTTWATVGPPTAAAGLALVGLWRLREPLDALLLGEDGARQLGVDPARLLRETTLWVALGVGAVVAATGIIGFVGLVVPHTLRLLVGPRHRALLPLAALGGAGLLVAADVVARVALPPSELPVGVLTSLLGAPFFLWLVARARDGELA